LLSIIPNVPCDFKKSSIFCELIDPTDSNRESADSDLEMHHGVEIDKSDMTIDGMNGKFRITERDQMCEEIVEKMHK
jgi:hypothetical protein